MMETLLTLIFIVSVGLNIACHFIWMRKFKLQDEINRAQYDVIHAIAKNNEAVMERIMPNEP